MARSEVAYSVDEALAIADKLGYPVVLASCIHHGRCRRRTRIQQGRAQNCLCKRSPGQPCRYRYSLRSQSSDGKSWSLKLYVTAKGNMITVCFIENIDPLGVHTGDSFCSAPMLTISEDVSEETCRSRHTRSLTLLRSSVEQMYSSHMTLYLTESS